MKTKLTVTHNGKDLTFLHPAYGPNNYEEVGEQIEKDGLLRATMAETASLVHAAFFDKLGEQHGSQVKETMRLEWLWASTGILYVPNKGVYMQDNSKIKNNLPYMEESDLVRKLQRNDKSVRFVPFGYKIGYMTPKELEKNEFIIGLAGIEGAEKLAEVGGKHKDTIYLCSLRSVNEPTTMVPILKRNWFFFDDCLYVGGHTYNNNWRGCIFGVQKNTEEPAALKNNDIKE